MPPSASMTAISRRVCFICLASSNTWIICWELRGAVWDRSRPFHLLRELRERPLVSKSFKSCSLRISWVSNPIAIWSAPPVCFIDCGNTGDLHEAGFHGLYEIPGSGKGRLLHFLRPSSPRPRPGQRIRSRYVAFLPFLLETPACLLELTAVLIASISSRSDRYFLHAEGLVLQGYCWRV